MKKTIKTFLKSAAKDYVVRSVNPPVVRASTILFKTMQELRKHQKDIAKGKDVAYGNQVSTLLPIAVASAIHAESRLGPRELGSLIPTEHSTAEALGIVIQAALEEASGADSQSDALLVGHPRR